MSTLNATGLYQIYTTRINTPNIKYAHRILYITNRISNMHTDSNKEANLKPLT